VAEIVQAHSSAHYDAARQLFEEYAASLPFNLDFQDFDRELAILPGEYALPTGSLLLAQIAGQTVGCVAIRRLGDDVCEMKRLYVVPQARSHAIGRSLATAAIAEARTLGYRRMRLDTAPSMHEARRLYQQLGFREIEAYRYNPIHGTTFMEIGLR
jgi:ribosomal protein S18 acetylase RimI-like enzyme